MDKPCFRGKSCCILPKLGMLEGIASVKGGIPGPGLEAMKDGGAPGTLPLREGMSVPGG